MDEFIFHAECRAMAVLEVFKPAPRRPVRLRDDLGHAVSGGPPGLRSGRISEFLTVFVPAFAGLEEVAEKVSLLCVHGDQVLMSHIPQLPPGHALVRLGICCEPRRRGRARLLRTPGASGATRTGGTIRSAAGSSSDHPRFRARIRAAGGSPALPRPVSLDVRERSPMTS
jgi:hypothetical protein